MEIINVQVKKKEISYQIIIIIQKKLMKKSTNQLRVLKN